MKVLIFIVLKIVEISSVIFVPYYLGRLVHLFTGFFCYHDRLIPCCTPFWVIGFVSMFYAIVIVMVIVMVILGLVFLGIVNWKLAEKLLKRIKD